MKRTADFMSAQGLYTLFSAFWASDEAQDLVEYSLLLAFIALASIAIIGSFGHSTSSVWSKVNSGLTSAGS